MCPNGPIYLTKRFVDSCTSYNNLKKYKFGTTYIQFFTSNFYWNLFRRYIYLEISASIYNSSHEVIRYPN
jgi:hypothetical protein